MGGVSATGSYPPVSSDMVLYYHFNNQSAYGENDTHVYDFSGNGNNGTITGNGSIIANGFIQKAFLGDITGIASNVITSNNLNLSTGGAIGITFSTWIKTKHIANSYVIDNLNQDEFSLYARLTSSSDIRFQVANETAQSFVSTGDIRITLIDGTWHNVVGTWNTVNGELKIYFDGMLKATESFNGSIKGIAETYKIGSRGGGTLPFNGSIDEVIIYNRSLSSNEITTNYNNYNDCGNLPYNGCNFNESSNIIYGNYSFSRQINIINNNTIIDGNGSNVYYDINNISSLLFNLTGLNNITIKNFNFIHNGNGSVSDAIRITSSSNINLYNINISSNNLTTPTWGYSIINLYASKNIFINNSRLVTTNCISNGMCHNIQLDPLSNVNVTNSYLYIDGDRSYNIFGGMNSYVAHNTMILNATGSRGNWNIHPENASYAIIEYNSFYTYSPQNSSCGIYLEENASFNTIRNNYFYSKGANAIGICLESLSSYNNFTGNIININDSTSQFNDYKYYKSIGIYLISTNVGNIFDRNNITLTNSSNATAITLLGGTNSPNSNNTFSNNYIITDLESNQLITFGSGVSGGVRSYNTQFINNSYQTINSIYKIYVAINNNLADGSPLIFNGLFNDIGLIKFNLYNFTFGRINLTSNYGYFSNLNSSRIQQVNLMDQIESLVYFSNMSGFILTGNRNISILGGNDSIVLPNYNLTEGSPRQYSPIWFAQSTLTEKHIASNLSDTITSDVIFSVSDCSNVGKITYTPNGASSIAYYPEDYTCSNNQVTISSLTINPSAESNVLLIEYGCSTFTNTGNLIIVLFSALAIGLFIPFYIYKKGIFNLEMKDLLIMFIGVSVVVVLYMTIGQNLGGMCGPVG